MRVEELISTAEIKGMWEKLSDFIQKKRPEKLANWVCNGAI